VKHHIKYHHISSNIFKYHQIISSHPKSLQKPNLSLSLPIGHHEFPTPLEFGPVFDPFRTFQQQVIGHQGGSGLPLQGVQQLAGLAPWGAAQIQGPVAWTDV
jgi:hypothetical protein